MRHRASPWMLPNVDYSTDGIYGGGPDGDLTISSDTDWASPAQRTLYLQNLTINSGVVLLPKGRVIYVNDTLNLVGTIRANGNNGGDATSTTAGNGAALTYTTYDYGGGNLGGYGQQDDIAQLPNSGGLTYSETLAGGDGGTGGDSTGSPGNVGAFGGAALGYRIRTLPFQPMFGSRGLIIGGAGGGGGGSGGYGGIQWGGPGGGGGSGAGACVVYARKVIGAGLVEMIGGNGGAGGDAPEDPGYDVGGGGGGGGGAGGLLYVISDSWTVPWSLDLSEGSGGAGGAGYNGGADGAAGSDGSPGVGVLIHRPTLTVTIL